MVSINTEKPTHIIIHHSAGKDHPTFDFDELKNYHTQVRGWEDIGYHYVIETVDGEPQIIQGRMLDEVGAHCPDQKMNRKGIGICCVGNFEEDMPTAQLLETLKRLVRSLMSVYGIPKSNIFGHGQIMKTACPGKNLSIDKFRQYL